MKNVSSAFREELKKDNRNYIKSADITLKNGTVLEIDNSNLWQNGVKLDTATSSPNSFDLGAIITGQLTLTLNNIDEKFSDYDFTDCTATNVKVGLKLPDGTTESLSYGKFYLNEAKYNGSIITLTFYDSIYKFDQPYSKSSLSYPATLRQIVQDSCSVCGVTQGTFTFDQDDFVVQERPDDSSITFRQVLQWVGQISCQYFYADVQGRLRMAWYDVGLLDSLVTNVEEGFLQDTAGEYVLDHNSEKINTLKLLSEPDDDVEESPYDDTMFHEIESFTSLTTGLDDVVITGIRIIQEVDSEDGGKENITIQYGTDGYVLGIEGNKFITEENASDVAAMVGIKTIGMQFRSFSANALSDPTIEPGDVVLLIDRKKKRYKSIVTNNTFHPGNFQAFSCGAKSPIRNSSTRFSQITQVYTDYRKELSQQRTDIETALAELDDRIENSSGLFTTIEEQPDGSKKYFLHDKPLLSDSEIVWSMTAEAWGVSTDGGQTQNAGMTVDGDTIVRILTAVGVNADWIKTGAFRIEKDGEVMFSADTETGIIDIVANSFTLKGQSIEDIAENQVNDFVDAVYTPAIDNIQKQIDGQIETYYYDYEPTLENVPAIDWTSEEERRSHEGDLFYWKSKGYAYRFFKDGDTWKWQMVQDTDITKALEQAAEAKDTADQKRRVFVRQPTPPYDVGDLWVGNNTSDLMRCQRARSSGSYNADDWIKAVKYTDDTELNNFIREDYSETIQEIYNSVDKKAQTWYQTTDPSLDWASTEESVLQDTDGNSILDSENNDIITLWEKEKSTHDGDLWRNPANNTEYMYVDGNWVEMSIPDEVFDTIDGKAQIFVTQPVPPYDVGDTWFTGTTILVCDTRRDSGEFVAEDWSKQDNYTDDSALYEFMEGDYKQTIEELQTQADSKAETWYQPTDPSDLWSSEEKLRHDGDIWYNTTSQKTYIYNGSSWEETKSNPPDEVFDTIDGKAQIFVRQPVPPYSVGDLWFNSATSDIMTCIVGREAGSYNASDWQKRNKYTDDSYAEEVAGDLSNFADQVVGDLENMQTQIDGKIETYYYDYQPTLTNIPASAWTTETERQKHIGDLFYYKSTGFTYRFLKDGSTWKWQAIKDEDISKALSDAAEAQDTADSKRRVFTSTPTPPYDVGDLWAQGGSGDIMRCIVARSSGSYVSTDWDKASKYTDDTAVDDLDTALDQEGVFNRLTNNGQAQGIFMRNRQLYINMSFAQSGTLKLGGSNNVNGLLQVYNSSGVLVGTIDNVGAKFTNGNDWLQISQSLLTGGYGSTTDGVLDLSANYGDGSRNVVLESKTGDVILKSSNEFLVQRQDDTTGYLIQSGGTDYFGDPVIEFGDTYPIIGIMYGEDEGDGSSYLDIRLANGKQATVGRIPSSFLALTVTGTAEFYKAPKLYNLSHVTSGGHLVFASDGATVAYLSSSSKRYKNHVSDMSDEEALKILDIPVIKFKYKDGYLFPTDFLVDKEIPGFYAEDVEEVNPILCQYNEDGSVEDWNYRTMIPYMLKTMQIQQKRIDNLQTQINELKTMILNMKGAQ